MKYAGCAYTAGKLEELHKAIESLRTAAVFEAPDEMPSLSRLLFAEQHFLSAIAALETAMRCMKLAELHAHRGE